MRHFSCVLCDCPRLWCSLCWRTLDERTSDQLSIWQGNWETSNWLTVTESHGRIRYNPRITDSTKTESIVYLHSDVLHHTAHVSICHFSLPMSYVEECLYIIMWMNKNVYIYFSNAWACHDKICHDLTYDRGTWPQWFLVTLILPVVVRMSTTF